MSHRRRSQRNVVSEINVVPYIDVMLVLLVIFLVTAPLLTQGVKVDLPRAKAQVVSTTENLPLIVSVDKGGNYYLNANASPTMPITSEKLMVQIAAQLQLAREKGHEPVVLVKGDAHVSYGKVVQAMALLQQAGVPNVGLMTQQQEMVG